MHCHSYQGSFSASRKMISAGLISYFPFLFVKVPYLNCCIRGML
nr:MAG TPA: hypothetical protein [Caudoviricetes sp.]